MSTSKRLDNKEKTGAILLLICTLVSLFFSNFSYASNAYIQFWNADWYLFRPDFLINEGLMTMFFLQVGLEIKKELFEGGSLQAQKALLPLFAAIGGMAIPALIHFCFNKGLPTERGAGIPMATDIAFSLAVLSLMGKRLPGSLRLFLTSLAIIDDLGAILVIAFFYSKTFIWTYLLVSLLLFFMLLLINKFKVQHIGLYLIPGLLMWYFMYKSGIHPTISGVLLAFAIPSRTVGFQMSRLDKILSILVPFIVLPLFALSNSCLRIPDTWEYDLISPNSLGIILGLLAGKPIGICLFTWLAVIAGICKLPEGIQLKNILGIGMVAGIGFTMAMFIDLLAYTQPEVITSSKIAILLVSMLSGILGYFTLKQQYKKNKIPELS